MAIQDEMYKLIVEELESTLAAGKEKVLVYSINDIKY